MRITCFAALPRVFCFLVLLQEANSRPLEVTDELSVERNLQRSVLSQTGKDKNSTAKSRPPGCCTPELYLGFDKVTTGQHELDGRRAQFPSGANEESPCGKFADLNAENVQFNSAKLATKTDAITISLWIKILTQAGIQPVLVVAGEDGELRLEIAQGHLSWLYTSIGPPLATFALLSVVPVVPAGQWTHLVVQYDAFTGRSAAFLNKKEILQGVSGGGSLKINWGEFTTIGQSYINEVLRLKMNGNIDEFYIYYCAVPEMVIQRLADSCHVDGKCAAIGPGVNEPCDSHDAFYCKNGKCVGQEWRCDGVNDCGDWSDEAECDRFCNPGEKTSSTKGRCVPCFCMGHSQKCSNSKMYRSRMNLEIRNFTDGPIIRLVGVDGEKVSGITYTAEKINNEVVAHNISKQMQYYWALPKAFLGNKITSYGGKLRFTVKHTPKSLPRLERVVREIISFENFEADFLIDRKGSEETIDGSGIEDVTTPKASTTGSDTTYPVTDIGIEEDETITSVSSPAYNTESATTVAYTLGPDTTYPVTVVTTEEDKTTTSVPSSAYSSQSSAPEASTTGSDRTYPVTDIATEEAETTPSVPSSAYSTKSAVPKVFTAEPDTTYSVTDIATEQGGTTPSVSSSAYSLESTVPEASAAGPDTTYPITDMATEEGKTSTSVSFSDSTDSTIQEASITVPDTTYPVTDVVIEEDETTASVPSSAYSTEGTTTETSTTGSNTTYSATDVATEEDATSTSAPSSEYGTESTTLDASTTGPETTYPVTDVAPEEDKTSTAVPSSAHTSESTAPEASTTGSDTTYPVTDIATEQGGTTPSVPSSAYSTHSNAPEAPTAGPDTTYPVTDIATEEDETTTSAEGNAPEAATTVSNTTYPVTDMVTEEDETTTSVPSSAYSTESSIPEAPTTGPETTDPVTDMVTEEDDTTPSVPSLVYTTESITPDLSTTAADTTLPVTDITTDGEDGTTTSAPSPVYNTYSASKEALTEKEGEPTTLLPSSAYNTYITTSEVSSSITDTTFPVKDATTEGRERGATFVLSLAYSIDHATSEVSTAMPDITDPATGATTQGEDETTPSAPLSAYTSDSSTKQAHTTVSDSTYPVTDATTEGEDETTTSAPLSAYTAGSSPNEALTAVPDMTYPVTDATTEGDKEVTTVPSSAYSTDSTTTEVSTAVPDTTTSLPRSVSRTETTATETSSTVLGSSTTEAHRYTDDRKERSAATPSTFYGTDDLSTPSVTKQSGTPFIDASSDAPDETTFWPTSIQTTERPSTDASATPVSRIIDAVLMVGKDATLVFHHELRSDSENSQVTMEVSITEVKWRLPDGVETSRHTFMRVLSDIQAIYIRASYGGDASNLESLSIKDPSLDVASQHDAGFGKALLVEQCDCPVGYSGLSCESCKPGYYKSRVDPDTGVNCVKCDCEGYSNDSCDPQTGKCNSKSCRPGYYKSRFDADSGKCVKCNCHDHSDEFCDPETGECKNCLHNTTGFHCEKCLEGFYGNATIGGPTNCKECPCPMTSPPNRFSPTCFMADDGQPTCDACAPGYGGRRCNRCVKPYFGNPTEPGGTCKREVDCKCDARGSLNSTCDPETMQCFCKVRSCTRSFLYVRCFPIR